MTSAGTIFALLALAAATHAATAAPAAAAPAEPKNLKVVMLPVGAKNSQGGFDSYRVSATWNAVANATGYSFCYTMGGEGEVKCISTTSPIYNNGDTTSFVSVVSGKVAATLPGGKMSSYAQGKVATDPKQKDVCTAANQSTTRIGETITISSKDKQLSLSGKQTGNYNMTVSWKLGNETAGAKVVTGFEVCARRFDFDAKRSNPTPFVTQSPIHFCYPAAASARTLTVSVPVKAMTVYMDATVRAISPECVGKTFYYGDELIFPTVQLMQIATTKTTMCLLATKTNPFTASASSCADKKGLRLQPANDIQQKLDPVTGSVKTVPNFTLPLTGASAGQCLAADKGSLVLQKCSGAASQTWDAVYEQNHKTVVKRALVNKTSGLCLEAGKSNTWSLQTCKDEYVPQQVAVIRAFPN